jgi:hypothetical protein
MRLSKLKNISSTTKSFARFNSGLNFELSSDHLAFRELARDFARKKILPKAAELDLYAQ